MRQTRRFWHALGALAVASTALAEPNIPNMDLTATDTGTHIKIEDNQASGAMLMNIPKSSLIYLQNMAGGAMTLNPGDVSVTFDLTRKDGVTATISITNTTLNPVRTMTVMMYGLWLEADIAGRNFNSYGQARQLLTLNSGRTIGPVHFYPSAYSPVLEFSNNLADDVITPPVSYTPPGRQYAVGCSLIHDPMAKVEPLHQRVEQASGTNRANPNWAYLLEWNAPSAPGYDSGGLISPSETLTFKVEIRVARVDRGTPANWWMRTLEPYRQHFRSTYGGVQYSADTRPVNPFLAGGEWNCLYAPGPVNTHGLGWGLDAGSYTPCVVKLQDAEDNYGYRRHMIWAPTGVYCTGGVDGTSNNPHNYPFFFTSEWSAYGMNTTDLATFAAGSTVGLWWGNSMQMHDAWPATVAPGLDPTDPVDLAAAEAEIQGAFDVNVFEIGLDAYTSAKLPDQDFHATNLYAYAWGQTVNLRLIGEQTVSDIMHLRMGNFISSWGANWLGSSIPHPHYLSDLLAPGHETWYALNEAADTPASVRQAKAATIASNGFVYIDLGQQVDLSMTAGGPNNPIYNAAPTWETSVPIDILRCNLADIAFDDLTPFIQCLWSEGTLSKSNAGINSSDYFAFTAAFFNSDPEADVAYDDGTPLPPFGYNALGTNSGVTSADYFTWYAAYSAGCP